MKYLTLIFICLGFGASAQDKLTNQDYIDLYYTIAVRKMAEFKIPASITLAQGILESGSGNSKLAQNANNHFGIKCHSDWTGKGYYMDDDAKDECFRVYDNPEDSFNDHSKFLTERARYKFLFIDFQVDDYKSWAKGLKQAGYATNPKYPELLIALIERNELHKYDKMGLSEMMEFPLADNIDIIQEMKDFDKELPKNSYFIDGKTDVFIYNKAKTVRSNGRQILAIANQYGLDLDKLKNYNDIYEGYTFEKDQFIYLQAKRKKGTEKTHLVKEGETMWEISQLYAIKLDKLYKKNRMVFDKQAKPGETIYLKSKRADVPQIYTYKEVLEQKNKIIAAEAAKKQALIDAEKKVNELAAQKKLNAELAAQRAVAEKQAKLELSKREAAALQLELEAQKQKQQFDAEQHPPIQVIDASLEKKALDEEVAIEKPYQEATVKTYKVKLGDTLYSLSNKFYITVEKLKALNNMKDNNLSVGQVLVVSP
jgi:LysM repeat protein